MRNAARWLSLLGMVALVAGCFGSPTGPKPEPKQDTDDGTGKQEVVARARDVKTHQLVSLLRSCAPGDA